jgi:hypothetical protein
MELVGGVFKQWIESFPPVPGKKVLAGDLPLYLAVWGIACLGLVLLAPPKSLPDKIRAGRRSLPDKIVEIQSSKILEESRVSSRRSFMREISKSYGVC